LSRSTDQCQQHAIGLHKKSPSSTYIKYIRQHEKIILTKDDISPVPKNHTVVANMGHGEKNHVFHNSGLISDMISQFHMPATLLKGKVRGTHMVGDLVGTTDGLDVVTRRGSLAHWELSASSLARRHSF
jgi:hypothetical protein